MESYLKVFSNYIEDNYDMNDKNIREKYEHTLRVASLMVNLSMKLGLNNNDIILAFKIGLFHDLGRFREIVRNKEKERKFNNLTFDHGAYSVKILYNDGLINYFDVNKEDSLIIKKALYFHNKKDLSDNLSEREELFCKMIRDVDKLDLLYIRSQKRKLSLKENVTEIVLNNYLNDETIDIKNLSNDSDRVVFYLSFIKDLSFDESFSVAINNGYLDKLLSIFVVSEEKKGLFDELLYKLYERNRKDTSKKVQLY